MCEFICVGCKKYKNIFHSVEHLEAHIAETHFSTLPFSCTFCEYGGRFPTETAIMTHMKECHQVEDEFKFYSIFDKDTIEKRRKVAELLQKCIAPVAIAGENNLASEGHTAPVHISKPIDEQQKNRKKNSDTDKATTPTKDVLMTLPSRAETEHTHSKPAKIPRIQTPASIPTVGQIDDTNSTATVAPTLPIVPSVTNNDTLLQVPSIIRQALQGNGNQTQSPEINQKAAVNGGVTSGLNKKNFSSSNGQKRAHKEKRNHDKKSETATKGGYTGVDIDHLFSDPKADLNASVTDDEHSEDDGNTSSREREEVAKVSKGIPQHDFELPPTFFSTKSSARLGLVLHKAESEGRDFQTRNSRGQSQKEEGQGLEDFLKQQGELASKRNELEQYREIKADLDGKIKERDKMIEEQIKQDDKHAKRDKTEQAKRESNDRKVKRKRIGNQAEDDGRKNVKRERLSSQEGNNAHGSG